jgi:hypothetical protein
MVVVAAVACLFAAVRWAAAAAPITPVFLPPVIVLAFLKPRTSRRILVVVSWCVMLAWIVLLVMALLFFVFDSEFAGFAGLVMFGTVSFLGLSAVGCILSGFVDLLFRQGATLRR